MFKPVAGILAAFCVLCSFVLVPLVWAGDKATSAKAGRSSKVDLAPDSLGKLHALIRPHESEWRHLNVHWITDVVAARRRAAAEDKPLVICYTGGAGYNEPLGVC